MQPFIGFCWLCNYFRIPVIPQNYNFFKTQNVCIFFSSLMSTPLSLFFFTCWRCTDVALATLLRRKKKRRTKPVAKATWDQMQWVWRVGGVAGVRSGLISFGAVEVSVLRLYNRRLAAHADCYAISEGHGEMAGDFYLLSLVLVSLSYDSLITHRLKVRAVNKWPINIVADRLNWLFWMESWHHKAAQQTAYLEARTCQLKCLL